MTTRRQVIRGAGGLITVLVGGALISCNSEETALIEATRLSDHQLLTLVRIFQHILPHRDLDEAVFRSAVAALANGIADDDGKDRQIGNGIAILDESSVWLDRSDADQREALEAVEDSAFFALLRTAAIEAMYRDERTWALIGYEGEAIRFGGYIDRGFNDIDWLPEPGSDPEEV